LPIIIYFLLILSILSKFNISSLQNLSAQPEKATIEPYIERS